MRKLDKKGQGAMEYLMTYGWAIMVVMIVGVVLWQMGIFKLGQGGKGYSGFGQVKPLDHTSPASQALTISFTNGVGARIDSVIVISSDGTGAAATLTPDASPGAGSISPGDNFQAALTAIPDICPTGADSYDWEVNVSYNNTVTGLEHHASGRIWGPC